MTGFIGASLVTCAGGALGFAYAARQKTELAATEALAEFFDYLLLRLPSLVMLDELVGEFENVALEKTGFLPILKDVKKGETCNKRYFAAIELFSDDKALYAVLQKAGKHLGGTEYSLQAASLKDTRDCIKLLEDKRRAAFAAGEKCYRWLGVLMGAAVSILML